MHPIRSGLGTLALSGVLVCHGLLLTGGWAGAQEKVPIIRAIEGLRFDPPRFKVTPGQEWHLRFENSDTTAQPHNLVVVRPGTRESVLAAALALGADGPARGYVPETAEVIAFSRLLAAGEREDLAIRIPDVPGIYPIVCTFPGHGVIMYGALYAGVAMPRLEDDLHVPKPPPLPRIDPDPRPMVRRIFLPDAGPAAIAVALPGDVNLCWDAGACRLRYVWRGGFLETNRHFQGKGQALAELGGPVVMTAPSVFPVRIGGNEPKSVGFRGYSVLAGLPTFEYLIDGQLVKESFSMDAEVLIRRFQILNVEESVAIQVGVPPSVSPAASRGTMKDEVLRLTREEAADVAIRYAVPASSTQRMPSQ
ncbi:MAG: hypothetical protein ACKV19_17905 [Verrucomicrobiales bacterium]